MPIPGRRGKGRRTQMRMLVHDSVSVAARISTPTPPTPLTNCCLAVRKTYRQTHRVARVARVAPCMLLTIARHGASLDSRHARTRAAALFGQHAEQSGGTQFSFDIASTMAPHWASSMLLTQVVPYIFCSDGVSMFKVDDTGWKPCHRIGHLSKFLFISMSWQNSREWSVKGFAGFKDLRWFCTKDQFWHRSERANFR